MRLPARYALLVVLAAAAATAAAQETRPATAPATQPATAPATQPAAAATRPATAPAVERPPATGFALRVESEYGADIWHGKSALEADLTVEFGGNTIIDGRMIMKTDTSRVRMEMKNGTVLVFDGEHAWVSPADAQFPMARFHLLTWPYFAAVPFKLRDPGANLQSERGRPTVGESQYDLARLTFEAGIGDAPDDWYLLYRNRETGTIDYMAYIVTYGDDAEAVQNAEPHAIRYEEFERIDGVLIPHDWHFIAWSEEDGPHGDRVGRARLSNARFVEPAVGAFDKPEDAREDELPRP